MLFYQKYSMAIPSLALAIGLAGTAPAAALPLTAEIEKYLLVGMRSSAIGDAVNVNSSNELGANQEFLSPADPNTLSVFFQGGDRWRTTTSPTAPPDTVLAGPVFTGIDFKGNTAVTSSTGKFNFQDINVYAGLGVHCASTPGACIAGASNTTWFQSDPMTGVPLGPDPNGVFNFNPAPLLSELTTAKAFLLGLAAEATITADIVNQNRKDGAGPHVLDITGLDTNGDGLVIVDIDVDGDFDVNNSDWIVQGPDGIQVVFRIKNGSNFSLSNSSILTGDGGIDGILFLHTSETAGSSDNVFDFNNVILSNVALWDLNTIGDTGTTKLDIDDGQGCAQFISSGIVMNDVRWGGCAFAFDIPPPPPTDVPEPGTLTLTLAFLVGLGLLRRRRAI